MSTTKMLERLYIAGMLVLFAGIILAIAEKPYAIYIYGLGLTPVLGIRIFNFLVSNPQNKRKNLILVVSALFLLVAGIAFFINKSWWIVFIALSATLDFYISFRRFT